MGYKTFYAFDVIQGSNYILNKIIEGYIIGEYQTNNKYDGIVFTKEEYKNPDVVLDDYGEVVVEYDSKILEDFEIIKITEDDSIPFIKRVTWYNHENDMKELSILYPEVVFKLRGFDEQSGDSWVKYFKNGKMQIGYTEIIRPPYDENKLI